MADASPATSLAPMVAAAAGPVIAALIAGGSLLLSSRRLDRQQDVDAALKRLDVLDRSLAVAAVIKEKFGIDTDVKAVQTTLKEVMDGQTKQKEVSLELLTKYFAESRFWLWDVLFRRPPRFKRPRSYANAVNKQLTVTLIYYIAGLTIGLVLLVRRYGHYIGASGFSPITDDNEKWIFGLGVEMMVLAFIGALRARGWCRKAIKRLNEMIAPPPP